MDIHSHISCACMLARGTFTPPPPFHPSARWLCSCHTIACTRRLCSPTSQPKSGFLYLLLPLPPPPLPPSPSLLLSLFLLPLLFLHLLLLLPTIPLHPPSHFTSTLSPSSSFNLPSHCIHPSPSSSPPSLTPKKKYHAQAAVLPTKEGQPGQSENAQPSDQDISQTLASGDHHVDGATEPGKRKRRKKSELTLSFAC